MRCVWTKINFLNVLFTGPNFPEFLLPFRKPKRIRTAFSPNQLLKLEQAFEKNQYVVGQERKELAKSLNLSETQVRQLSIHFAPICAFYLELNQDSACIQLNWLSWMAIMLITQLISPSFVIFSISSQLGALRSAITQGRQSLVASLCRVSIQETRG